VLETNRIERASGLGEEGVDLAEDALLVVVAEVDFEEHKLPTLGVGAAAR